MKDNWITAHNQVIGMGEKIKEDFIACPNAMILKEALSKCGETLSIAQLEYKLSITSNKFRALVPCMSPENLPRVLPDTPSAVLNNNLRASISALAPLYQDDENALELASILIEGGSAIATDRKVILQHWHGIDLPSMALPKAVINPVMKNSKNLKSFGYSNSSCTLYYEDDSWLKCQFYIDKWPDVGQILDKQTNQQPLPPDFFIGLKAIEKFSENGDVYFDTGLMRSHPEDGKGATYEVVGLPKGPVFKIKQLKMLEPFIKSVDFFVPHRGHLMTIFHGENCRGAIAGIAK